MLRCVRMLAVLLALGVMPTALTVLSAPPAAAAPETPKQTIEDYYATLLKAMQNGPKLGYKGRYDLLKPAVEKTFNLTAMAQASVGAYWDSMSEPQRKALVSAFEDFTIANYAHNFDSYDGEKFVTTSAQTTPRKDVIVYSAIVQSNGDKVSMNYLLRESDNQYKVIDIYLDGTISQLATRRSEYTSLIRQSGVDALIQAIHKKADQLAN
ncbi:MAG TPA: ABC transporter substrate-binding protein [Alphaproteobacteria bacterium]|nr:ABC transporter substrate-binding protein [Alphaproteobacteria bacterium]